MLDQFKAAFGDKLIYYDDVIRSTGTVMNCFIEKEKENHHYLLGLEIIRDVYTLAACNGFVCGMSYVQFYCPGFKESKWAEIYKFIIGSPNQENGVDLKDANAKKR